MIFENILVIIYSYYSLTVILTKFCDYKNIMYLLFFNKLLDLNKITFSHKSDKIDDPLNISHSNV